VASAAGQLLLCQRDEVQRTVDAARTGVLNRRSTIERMDGTAVLELSNGHMISGGGQAAAAAMRLVLLGAGLVTGGALVGVRDFDFS
jgi:hypothetical protein